MGKQETGKALPSPTEEGSRGKVSLQSLAGLNAANFFLAEITGVVMPFLGAYLQV